MKKLLIAIPIILLFLASGCVTGWFAKEDDSNTPQLNFTTGPAYEYNPTEYLPDWELVSEKPRLGKMPLEIQEELNELDILDAATWEYQRGNESLYVWAKVYETSEGAINASKPFTSIFAWPSSKTYLAFADEGAVGVYRNFREAPPLLIYAVKDDVFIHITYYNEDGKYNPEREPEDKLFLINLVKSVLNL